MPVGASVPALTERWSRLGRTGAVTVEAVELWTVELPFRDAVRTARGSHRSRPVVLVRLVGRGHQGPGAAAEGWGECAALADTTFDAEDVARSYEVLRESPGSGPAGPDRPGGRRTPGALRPGGPAAGGTAGALWPSPPSRWPWPTPTSVPRGGRWPGCWGWRAGPGGARGGGRPADTADQLVASVGDLVDQGYSRVKLKIGPGWDVEPVAAVAAAFPRLRLQVDANGSYRPEDGDHLPELDRFGLLCIEQPFERDDLAAHARLAARMTTPICLDESLDSPPGRRRRPGPGGLLGGLREAGPPRRAGRRPRGDRAVRRPGGPALDGGHVRVRLRPGGQHRPRGPRRHGLARGPEPFPHLPGGRPGPGGPGHPGRPPGRRPGRRPPRRCGGGGRRHPGLGAGPPPVRTGHGPRARARPPWPGTPPDTRSSAVRRG